MGKSSAESVKATHQFPLPNTKLVAPKLFLVSLPPPPQFSSGATALCEDQWKETGSERWGQNWEFIPKLDCPELLRPDREPGPRLSDPSTLVEFGFNSSVNQRGGQFPPHSQGWPLHDRVTAPVLSPERYRCRPGLCVGRRRGLKL